jgi:hypothetical protein
MIKSIFIIFIGILISGFVKAQSSSETTVTAKYSIGSSIDSLNKQKPAPNAAELSKGAISSKPTKQQKSATKPELKRYHIEESHATRKRKEPITGSE